MEFLERRGRYLEEVRERAVRLVFEQQESHSSQWAAIASSAGKMGCTAETLRNWVRRAERDAGKRPGLTSSRRASWRASPEARTSLLFLAMRWCQAGCGRRTGL